IVFPRWGGHGGPPLQLQYTLVKPLEGRTIIVTRAASQAADLTTMLEAYGANVIVCPTIEIRDPDNYERLDEALDHLYGYDWLIFTSTNGVDYFLKRLTDRGQQIADLDEIKVCAIGQRTADKLHDAHVHVDLVPSQSTAEGVFASLSEFAGGDEHLRGLNILLPRAATGREVLPDALQKAGARIDVVTTYQTVVPENIDRGKLAAMLTGSGDCIAFTSPSTIKNLAKLFDTHDLGKTLPGMIVACIGSVTAEAAAEYGLRVDIVPQQTTTEGLAQAIAAYYERG
ncbi:MAG TPA: uroporphyrinogen-III synthase, partial [Pyrinomonadaceae bacterium]|nr:uroporphyrinogen-III synthase [Pyrinomonadaceae bacterium]